MIGVIRMPKQELHFANPITNLPGTLGFYPDFKRLPILRQLGAFFTNPISLHSRSPIDNRRSMINQGVLLLHAGFPNPGIRQVIKTCASRWQDSEVSIIPQLWADQLDDVQRMLELLENLSNIGAVSLSFAPDIPVNDLVRRINQIQCELPLILQVPADRLGEYCLLFAKSYVSGLSLAARRGSLPAGSRKLLSGRLFGRSLFPQTLQALHGIEKSKLIIIASGGIYTRDQADACLNAGADAVQLDTAFWLGLDFPDYCD
jgi:dihydroorotate dehydrogenase